MKSVRNRKAIQQMVAAARDCVAKDEKALMDRYNQRHIAKAVYSSKSPFFITQELRSELEFLRLVLSDPKTFPWVGHIAHIIPRDHDFVSYGDSSLFAAGG